MISDVTEMFRQLETVLGEVEISKELYWQFLEVLPPRDQGFRYFVFGEGDWMRVQFNETGDGKFSAFYKHEMVVSKNYQSQVYLQRNRAGEPFKVVSCFIEDGDHEPFIGRLFPSLDEARNALEAR